MQFELLGKRFGLALLAATLLRLLFFIFNSYFLQFPVAEILGAFVYGILYDVSALIYLHSLFIFIHLLPYSVFKHKITQGVLRILFVFFQGVFTLFNLLDTGYFPISGRRSGLDLFLMGKELDGMKTAYVVDYWYLFVLLFSLIWVQYKAYQKIGFRSEPKEDKAPHFVWQLLARLVLVALLIIGVRGGVQLIPLNTFDAARQTRPELVSLVVNTPFNMIISSQQSGLSERKYMSEEQAALWFRPKTQLPEAGKGKRNIVLIVVESLGKEYCGFYNNGKGYTPFLDSLMGCSEVFTHAYANGKKSIEGIPAILSSMPSWMQTPYLSSYYQSNYLGGIGNNLQEIGYSAAFYHGGKNGTMSFDNFIALSNAGNYFGSNEYPNKADLDGNWGVFDKPYLAYFANELGTLPAPFFGTVFTLSSHHPYTLPAGDENKYPKGTLPIHATIGYADDALRQFFYLASQQPWYDETTFIITADHSADNETPYYQSNQGRFEIPLLKYVPHSAHGSLNETTVSHADILNLVMQEVGYDKPFYSFGTYLKKEAAMPVAIQFQDRYFQAIHWPWVYQFDGENALGLYQVSQDSLMRNNLLFEEEYAGMRDSLAHMTKAVVQWYSNDIIANKAFR